MCTLPAAYSQEFGEGVVRVARSRQDGVTLARIAKDFGIHGMTLHEWVRQVARRDRDAVGSGPVDAEPHLMRTCIHPEAGHLPGSEVPTRRPSMMTPYFRKVSAYPRPRWISICRAGGPCSPAAARAFLNPISTFSGRSADDGMTQLDMLLRLSARRHFLQKPDGAR